MIMTPKKLFDNYKQYIILLYYQLINFKRPINLKLFFFFEINLGVKNAE